MTEREPIRKYVDCKTCVKRNVCMYKKTFEEETVEVPVFPFLKVDLKCSEYKTDAPVMPVLR